MNRWIIIVVIVGMLGWAGYEYFSSDSGPESELPGTDSVEGIEGGGDIAEGLEKGEMAPDFELELMNGESVKLSEFRGEKVMLNFWATWCPPCRAEMPDMQKLHENKDVTILAVDLLGQESGMEAVEEFLEDYGITFNVLLDDDLVVAEAYGIQPIPTTYMIDTNGVIQNMAFGALNYELMVQELDKLD